MKLVSSWCSFIVASFRCTEAKRFRKQKKQKRNLISEPFRLGSRALLVCFSGLKFKISSQVETCSVFGRLKTRFFEFRREFAFRMEIFSSKSGGDGNKTVAAEHRRASKGKIGPGKTF